MSAPLTPEELLKFIAASPSPVSKREIADSFRVSGNERVGLKHMLKDLENSGAVTKAAGEYSVPDSLPTAAVVEVFEVDIDGDVFARPVDWDETLSGPLPRVEMMPDKRGQSPLKEGDRVLARLRKVSDNNYTGQILRRMDEERGRVLGMVIQTKGGFLLQPTDKKAKYDFEIPQKDLNGAEPRDLAVGEIQPARGLHRKKVRIIEVIGREDDPKAISLIALHEAGLKENFPERAFAETKGMTVPPLGDREDVRDIPLVTIDGIDARDFDDAVFAEVDGDGFHLVVAIADVSHYVRPGTALDLEGYRRGNSTYFPDRVVPMLPEALSNDLCSLRPNEDRACMGFHLWIDAHGELKKQKVFRGLMRSRARLTYEQVQAARDGRPDDLTRPLVDEVISPLYSAFRLLAKARARRGALELDVPERQVVIDKSGKMTGVKIRERYDSHKLIEEFMILANVAAAQALEERKSPCVYRVHDRPSAQKLDAAAEFVQAFGLSMPKGQIVKPSQINQILERAKSLPYSHLVSEVILRSQAQAIYSTENIGHFGLALRRYAHFTSPIRRYSDLLVHRSLIRAYGLGKDGMEDSEAAILEEKCMHISKTERTSMEAERSAVNRFTAAWLSERVGAQFQGRINGVTRFGLFITLNESGADGLVPIRTLPQDFYVHDERQHALIGRRSRRVYRLGAPVLVRLVEADGLTGSTIFEMVGTEGADIPGTHFKSHRPHGKDRDNHRRDRKKRRDKDRHRGRHKSGKDRKRRDRDRPRDRD